MLHCCPSYDSSATIAYVASSAAAAAYACEMSSVSLSMIVHLDDCVDGDHSQQGHRQHDVLLHYDDHHHHHCDEGLCGSSRLQESN